MGAVALASTNDHLMLGSNQRFYYSSEPAGNPYRPSVDVFCESAARYWTTPGVGVILTGMGSDGGRGMLALQRAGWLTLRKIARPRSSTACRKPAVELRRGTKPAFAQDRTRNRGAHLVDEA